METEQIKTSEVPSFFFKQSRSSGEFSMFNKKDLSESLQEPPHTVISDKNDHRLEFLMNFIPMSVTWLASRAIVPATFQEHWNRYAQHVQESRWSHQTFTEKEKNPICLSRIGMDILC